ncbi:hypothetical protein DSECCO2_632930 [anaerobic digester metagenome]
MGAGRGAIGQVVLRAVPDGAEDAAVPTAVLGENRCVHAVAQGDLVRRAEAWPLQAAGHAHVAGWLLAVTYPDDADRKGGDGEDGDERGQGRGLTMAGVLDGFGAVPDMGPVRAHGQEEGDEQRGPRCEAAQGLGDAARAAGVPLEARHEFVQGVAADKGQVDQGGHAQAHVVEPDEDAHPIVGQEVQEGLDAPAPEGLGREDDALPDGGHGAEGAVLVVPGRVRGDAQQGVDDRRHPQAPAQDAHGLLGDGDDALAAGHEAHRRPTAGEEGRQEEEIDAEEWGGQGPVDDARHGLVEEQPRAAGLGAEIHGAPFAEQRVDDVVLRVLDVQGDVHAEFVQHHSGLAGVHVPSDGPAHEAAQQCPVQVDAPALQTLPPAPELFLQVREHAGSRKGHCPHACPEQEAGSRRLVHERLNRDEMQPQPQQRPA